MKKKQKQSIVYVSRCICKITQSLNIKQHINQISHMLPYEISMEEVIQDCASFGVGGVVGFTPF